MTKPKKSAKAPVALPMISPGFDPVVVAKFFSTLSEIRGEIKDFRQDLQHVRDEINNLSKTIAAQTEKLSGLTKWQDQKAVECLRHQTLTTNIAEGLNHVRNEFERAKGTGEGISLAWKIVAGVALLVSTAMGVMVGMSKLHEAREVPQKAEVHFSQPNG